jgi:hypothetical protein
MTGLILVESIGLIIGILVGPSPAFASIEKRKNSILISKVKPKKRSNQQQI